jgi:superfamily II DNA/RNA helicase
VVSPIFLKDSISMSTTASPTLAAAPTSFAACGVPAVLVDHLAASGIDSPFPIQSATLPDSLAGRDVLGRGRTGSGKTLAFGLPLVTRLAADGRRTKAGAPRGLVLVPTRELANQVLEVVTPLAQALSLRATVIFGGVGQGKQVQALQSGVDIVIATPGRLEDLMQQGHCRLDQVSVTVLDEADHMADLGFLPAVTRILGKTPERAQRLLFSATLDRGIDVLVKRFLHDPVTHSVDPVEAPVTAMTHHVMTVDHTDKTAVVHELASGMGRSVLFTRTKHGAKKLAKQLTTAGIPAVDLHGNLGQSARERNLAAFSDGSVRVLVATDIAARGIHVDDVALVVHVDPPAEHKAYLHRSGRTARAGAGGVVVTVATREQSAEVRTLAKQAGIKPTVVSVVPGAPEIAKLRGNRAPHVTPAPAPVTAPQRATAQRSDRAAGRPAGAPGRRSRGRGRSGGPGRTSR